MPLLTGPGRCVDDRTVPGVAVESAECPSGELVDGQTTAAAEDRKSTRLNSSHSQISYAVFCLKKKKTEASPAAPPTLRTRQSRSRSVSRSIPVGDLSDTSPYVSPTSHPFVRARHCRTPPSPPP